MMFATPVRSHARSWTLALAALTWLVVTPASGSAEEIQLAQAANPCSGKNPCGGGNPCNPCGGANSGNPCGGANPCNPCGAGAAVDATRFVQPDAVTVATSEALVPVGEALWNDASLGKTGLACATCHVAGYAQMNASFAEPFPHRVAMPAARAGVAQVNAAEMVNFCMLVPMGTEPLAWDSAELAALTSYVEHIQPGFEAFLAAQSNPCGGNPCNPCGGSPRSTNPCNPCGGRNPCSP